MQPTVAAASAETLPQDAPPKGGSLLGGIVIALLLVTYLTVTDDVFSPLLTLLREHKWSLLVVRPTALWAVMATTMLVVRSVLWIGYRPAAPVDAAAAPLLTVVIPAFNEGEMVARSIESVVAASYPHGRLQVLAVDDGSTDSTWSHIERVAGEHPDVVTALRLPKNQGKRAALAEGFRKATGEIIVTMDSDSVIDPGTLLSIVGPFRKKSVGAVAGKVAVLNRSEGVIPRMLAIRFLLTFDMMRAVQSTYGTVFCCPGALTAYRSDILLRVLDRWMKQSFLGVPCTIGEDRALTNFVFAEGFDAVYQRTAVVHTVVPTTYGRLCKMLLRWDRSHIREEIRFMGLLGKRPPVARVMSLLETLVSNLRYPVAWVSLAAFLTLCPSHPLMLIRLAFAIGLFSGINMLYCLHSERSFEILYGVLFAYFSFLALFWIFPYAIVTVRARGWLTR